MKLFRVVTEHESRIIGDPPGTIITQTIYFAAESISAVWDEIAWLRNDVGITILAIVEDAPAIKVIKSKPVEEVHY